MEKRVMGYLDAILGRKKVGKSVAILVLGIVGLAVVIPDAAWTPEAFCGADPDQAEPTQLPRLLAEQGFLVVIPMLISREQTFSGNPTIIRDPFANNTPFPGLYALVPTLGAAAIILWASPATWVGRWLGHLGLVDFSQNGPACAGLCRLLGCQRLAHPGCRSGLDGFLFCGCMESRWGLGGDCSAGTRLARESLVSRALQQKNDPGSTNPC